MSRQKSNNSRNLEGADSKKFSSVTRHLRYQDFKWLKEDMGFFGFPEDTDWPLDWYPPVAQSTGQKNA